MEDLLLDIVAAVRRNGPLSSDALATIIRKHNKNILRNDDHYAKKQLLPFYLAFKRSNPSSWQSWGISPLLEKQLHATLQMKPRRTASGVATITVVTKPWACSSNCLYCPNDLRMPKSYLSDEPACQRAERNFFDPYLQVASRLRTLQLMGHAVDKIELIVLGGTWSDYPREYQIWFVTELFRALNEFGCAEASFSERQGLYKARGLSSSRDERAASVRHKQREVLEGSCTYNQAMAELYVQDAAWGSIAAFQTASFAELEQQHRSNETASQRVVGLAIETRPDVITPQNLLLIRRLGCTKVQMGIQSLNPRILALNNRRIDANQIKTAFSLLRLFGFKIHIHFMINLLGSTPSRDKADYRRLVTEPSYLPDEVKLYPCMLVDGTGLCAHYADGSWRPYSEEELIDVLLTDTLATPPYVRISRMIRDISAHDIVAGNKKINLRQSVETRAKQADEPIREIRHREIGTSCADMSRLELQTLAYETDVSTEFFLQWITPEGGIAGFLRLSLPREDYVDQNQGDFPVKPDEAMIREVHIYGKVAELHQPGSSAQHLGLGKRLVQAARGLAKEHGFAKLNVISSVGTREYYRSLGFDGNGLYQQLTL